MRARYRESWRSARLINTRKPLLYDMKGFTFTSRRVGKGSRLRVVVSPVNSIYSEKNYNSGGDVSSESMQDAQIATIRLYHDARHPTALFVPLGQPEIAIEPAAPESAFMATDAVF
jgi:predicted acyl esterase